LKTKAEFSQPMLLLRSERLPEVPDWLYELKLDGYRAIAAKSDGRVQLRSRSDKDLNARYPGLVKALGSMPGETVLDGEVVALDEAGRPCFNTLQNRGHGEPLHFFIFDLLILSGRDVMGEPLVKRRALIEKHVLPTLADPIRYSPILEASLPNLIRSLRSGALKGWWPSVAIALTNPASVRAPGSRCGSTKRKISSSAGTLSAAGTSMR
jgi:bifunctional non-homologous end joining protein LigD